MSLRYCVVEVTKYFVINKNTLFDTFVVLWVITNLKLQPRMTQN
jgi:hypothetical protein